VECDNLSPNPSPCRKGEKRNPVSGLKDAVMDMLENNLTDWNFISYEKIRDNPKQWNLTESDYRIFKKTDWGVTEKIHGANFAIVTDGEKVRFAKRKEFLLPQEDFFWFKSLGTQLVDRVKEIFNIIQADTLRLSRISVYGELFGGEYPHPEVTIVPNVHAVQTGVYYSPQIEYCAFDIALVESGNINARTYVDYDKAIKIFERVDMMCAQPLFIGKYESALAYNIEFNSTIPALLGLPKLPSPNKAEGVVIKPMKSFYLETTKGRIRPILKIKIPEFAEDSRFHQATKWTHFTATHTSHSLSRETELTQAMLSLVTETRLNNLISKIGRVERREQQTVEELLASDVRESFYEDYATFFTMLSADMQEKIISRLNEECQILVDKYFNN